MRGPSADPQHPLATKSVAPSGGFGKFKAPCPHRFTPVASRLPPLLGAENRKA